MNGGQDIEVHGMSGTIETVESAGPEATEALAARLEAELPDGTVLCLHGDLGAGKTHFVKGLARAMGVKRAVGSPTFTLINEYRGRRRLAHIDLYRIAGNADAGSLGLDEYLEGFDGITAIEWAERAAEWMPEGSWHLCFRHGADENSRTIEIRRPG